MVVCSLTPEMEDFALHCNAAAFQRYAMMCALTSCSYTLIHQPRVSVLSVWGGRNKTTSFKNFCQPTASLWEEVHLHVDVAVD